MAYYNKSIKSGERKLIGNVIKFCEEEKNLGHLKIWLGKSTTRIAKITGVSEKTVARIRKEVKECETTGKKLATPGKKRRTRRDKKVFDDFELCAIRNITLSFYAVKREVPTLEKVTAAIKEQLNVELSRETVRRTLFTVGFEFRKLRNKRTILIEKMAYAGLRQQYLRRLSHINSENCNRTIVYIGETWIHQNAKTNNKRGQIDNSSAGALKNQSDGEGVVVFHAGSKNGFINGALLICECKSKIVDFRSEINYSNFSKWVQDKLLPNIPQNCVIVMDNSSYHSVVLNKAPTNKKADIKIWLKNNNIDFDDNLLKPELLQLVKRNKGDIVYKIDEMFREAGHEVCRLPPYHVDLNPIDLVWKIVKQKVSVMDLSEESGGIKVLAECAIKSVTENDWKVCCEHVYNIEDMYREQDSIVDNEIDNVIVNITGDTESDYDCCTSDSDETDGGMSGLEELSD